jgi:hypothetical protein
MRRTVVGMKRQHRYGAGPHLTYLGSPCPDGYGDLVGDDKTRPPDELPAGWPGMDCRKCCRPLKGVALKLVSSAPYVA